MSANDLQAKRILGFFVVLLLLAASLPAQVITGTIIGQVRDKTGAVIQGAHIIATNQDTGFTQESNSETSGLYSIRSLPPGHYSVEVSASGFKTVKNSVTLEGNQQVEVNTAMLPGSVTEQVEVTAEAELLQTQESAVKSQVYENQIQNLPLSGRNPVELVLLGPSISISRQASGGSSLGFTVNGQSQIGSNLRLDGTDNSIGTDAMYFGSLNYNLNMTSVDAIQEFDIQTENYSADVRGSSGYVNVVTKSGTNRLHYDFYDFFRNGAMDARNYFQKQPGSLKQDDFGVTVGGPIRRNKAFFFLSYEGQRIHLPYPGFANVPTAAFRATVDPRLQVFLNSTPLPTSAIPGNANIGIFQDIVQQHTRQDLGMARVDFNLSQQDRLFTRYVMNDGVVDGAAPAGASGGNGLSIYPYFAFSEPVRHQTATVGWNHVFSPTLDSDLKVGLNRYLETRLRGPKDTTIFDIPVPSVPGVQIAGGGNTKKFGVTKGELDEKMVWVKGRSTLSFGGSYEHWLSGQVQLSVIAMSFPTLQAFAADAPSGLSSTFGTSLTEPSEHVRDTYYAFFVQEDFRATPNLTVNLGLRYDNFGVMASPNAENITDGPFSAYTAPGAPSYNGNNHDFSPRVGFAWKPLSANPLVLRGGLGLFYGSHASGQLEDVFVINNSQPFTISTTDFSNLSYPFSPGLFAFTHSNPGRTGLNPNTKDLYTEQWNLTAQYQFGQATTLSIAYVGNHQVHIPGEYLPNVFDPVLGNRPNPAFGSVKYISNDDTAFYHALQISFRHQLSHNIAWDTYYTWSHASGLETGSLENSASVGFSNDQIQTYKNRNYNRDNMPFDLRHQFTNDLTYQLPRLSDSDALVRNAFGGWSTSGILKAASGFPFNLVTGRDTGDGTVVQRPNLVPGQPIYLNASPAVGFLNKAAFSIPTAVDPATGLKLGHLGNNSVHMPATLTLDWALAKRLYAGDKIAVDFRSEFLNILNHPVFAIPVTNLLASAFGQSQSASDPREIQLMLRFSF